MGAQVVREFDRRNSPGLADFESRNAFAGILVNEELADRAVLVLNHLRNLPHGQKIAVLCYQLFHDGYLGIRLVHEMMLTDVGMIWPQRVK